MDLALHDRLPFAPWADPQARKLPGTRPAGADDWATVDEAYSAQMALRDTLLRTRRADVLALLPEARPAADELLRMGCARAARLPGFLVGAVEIERPDGMTVPLAAEDPLGTLGRMFQQDFCLLQRRDDGHYLTGAVLCFPSAWTLSEKIGRRLDDLHGPVASYDAGIARRVQRMFDGLKTGRPIWRANAHLSPDPGLFAPRREADPRPPDVPNPRYLRSERQVLFRLPETGVVVFSILTLMLPRDRLSPEQAAALVEHPVPQV